MKKGKRLYSVIALLAGVGMLFTACQPQIVEVEKEVIVEKVVEKEIEVEKEVVVEKEVKVEVEKIIEVEKIVEVQVEVEKIVEVVVEQGADITENIGTMTLIMDVPQLDPHKMLSVDTIVGFNAYEWLVYSDPTEGLVPMLATSWESNATGDEWTFHLREGVTFHDGTPFTAEAVKFSYQRTIDLGMVSYQIDAIDEMEVIDDHTIRFGLSEPRNLPTIVSSFYGLYIANPNLADKPEGWYEEGNDSGTGPYYIESYDPQRVVLSQYKDYWGGWEEGQFTTVVFESVADAAVREQMIRSGEADIIAKLPFENHAALEATGDVKVITSNASVGGFNLFNLFQLDLAPLDDVRVRQAISYAFPFGDVQAFSFSGLSRVARSIVPSSFLPPGDLSTYSYDLEKAQSLLEAAGVEEGTEIKLALRAGDEEVKKISLLWQAELAKIGIDMTVTEVASEWGVMFNTDSEYHVLAKTWSPGYPSPYEWLIFYDSRNTFAPYTGFVRPEVDALLDQALSTEAVDKVGSDRIYRQVAQLLHDEAIMLPVMDFPFDYQIRSDISGFRGHPFTWTGRWYEYSRE